MDSDKYNPKYYNNHKKKWLGKKIFILLAFSFVLLFLLFSAFYGGEVTGNVVRHINNNNSIEVKGSFSVPEISLKDGYEEVSMSLGKGASIKIDNNVVSLEEVENKIVLENFKGEIEFDEDSVGKLDGKVEKITINNVPINLEESGRLKVFLSESSKYSSLEIKEGVYLKNVFFTTSGTVEVGGDLINLNSERMEIKGYLGSLVVSERKLILEGLVEGLKIEGDSRSISLSK